MTDQFRFAIASDLHIALPHTISDHPSRFHLVEVSIPAWEWVIEQLQQLDLDFLLLPGDLTQDGEPENHEWLRSRLSQLPFPVYVVPGNHDVLHPQATEKAIGLKDFPFYYQQFGYQNPQQIYYTKEILPDVRLIGLNSNHFDENGKQIGWLDEAQFTWLKGVLSEIEDELVLVMIHHNVIEHLPDQSVHPLGRRYMLGNAPELLEILQALKNPPVIFTGHLHVQDIAKHKNIYEITTGSLVSFPHPYRVINYARNGQGNRTLTIQSHHIHAVPNHPDLSYKSREWIGDRSVPFMIKLLTEKPLNIPLPEAEKLLPQLRYFWADVAQGDTLFDFENFPDGARQYFHAFGALAADGTPHLIDNNTILKLF